MNAPIRIVRAAPIQEAPTRPSGVSIDYRSGSHMGWKGEEWNIEAFAPTREGLAQVMADHLVRDAKHEPRFMFNGIIPVDGGFVCRGKQYRYDTLTGRT